MPRSEAPPDPAATARDLALCAIEIICGARDLETIARWITDDVQRHLERRIVIAARGRSVRRRTASRPMLSVGTVRSCRPAAGVVEVSVVVHQRPRVRAVAVRMELGRDQRWRASAIHVL
ncbi:Rv3235 family protein [Curtobacterium ammoniigenes]|uniref:Rv3235 family protein n=1 Tax=Curtobacterium ammoniigenes TaxID=395387 RepID=UPI00082F2D42|nr:Rv3235 family protein [Curtobacterium ammoniigenes]